MSNLKRQFLNNCLHSTQLLLPQPCVLCGAGKSRAGLCAACDIALPRLPAPRCAICASPIPDGEICGACLGHPPRYDRVTAVFSYEFPVDAMIQAFKYGGNLALATVFAEALGKETTDLPDIIIPMPLSVRRLRERGFNQALEIARRVGKLTGIPVISHACRKVAETQPQAALPWKQRVRNVRGVFVCDVDLTGKKVAVIDDVMTTGSTFNELAGNLRRAGAVDIHGWVVARAHYKY